MFINFVRICLFPPFAVVRVRVGLAVLVVGAVVPAPGVDRVLAGHAVAKNEEHPQRQPRLVGPVRPKSVPR